MGRSSESQCKLCSAAQPHRELAEKMRIVGISVRDVSDFLTKYRDFPISHTAIGRHDSHFDTDQAVGKYLQSQGFVEVPVADEKGNISITSIAKHKLGLFWNTQKDVVPNDREAREWGKLLLDAAKTGNEQERTDLLRQMFAGAPPKQLPQPSIEGEFSEALN